MNQQELLQKVTWKDLRHLSTREMLIENNLTIPWFVAEVEKKSTFWCRSLPFVLSCYPPVFLPVLPYVCIIKRTHHGK